MHVVSPQRQHAQADPRNESQHEQAHRVHLGMGRRALGRPLRTLAVQPISALPDCAEGF
jgi:hypothetical protein